MWNQRVKTKVKWKTVTNVYTFSPSKNFIFILCMYEMVDNKNSAETWNKAKVSVIKMYENNNLNKTVLLLLCISDTKKDGMVKISMTWLIKKLKEIWG